MELQDLLNDSDLDMTLPQVRAFFLGVLSADKPLPYAKAADELLSEVTEMKAELHAALRPQFDELQKDRKKALSEMFSGPGEFATFLESSKEQLDHFLTGMNLSGTSVDSTSNEDLSELIDELEDTVMELEEYLSSDSQTAEESEELKEYLLGAWQDFIDVRK
jgi:hypothetical protein